MIDYRLIGWVALIAFVVFVLSFLSCDSGTLTEERIDNITRVFMHEPTKFSFAVQDNAFAEIRIIEAEKCYGSVRIIPDVPADQKMWAKIVWKRRWDRGGDPFSMELHVRSEKSLEGAGWDHGKGGRGATEVFK